METPPIICPLALTSVPQPLRQAASTTAASRSSGRKGPPLARGPHDGRSCVTFAPAGTSSVIQTLPPMTAPRPTVTRPRMVAPA